MIFSPRLFNFGLIFALVLIANSFVTAQTSAIRPRLANANKVQTKNPVVEVPKIETVSTSNSPNNLPSEVATPNVVSPSGIITIGLETSSVRSRVNNGKPKSNTSIPEKRQEVLSSVIVNNDEKSNAENRMPIQTADNSSAPRILTIELNRNAVRPRIAGKNRPSKNTAVTEVRQVLPSIYSTKPVPEQISTVPKTTTAPLPKIESIPTPSKRERTKSPPREASKTAEVTLRQAGEFLRDEKFEDAARLSESVVEREPNNAEAWKLLGFSNYKMQQFEASANILRNAYDLKKLAGETDVEVLKTYAQALNQTDKSADALPLLSSETETNENAKNNADLWALRGEIEYKTNKVDAAQKSFKQAGELNSSDAKTQYFLGQIGYEKGDYDSAIASLNRAFALDSTNEMALRLLTTSYLSRATNRSDNEAKGDNQTAVNFGEKLIKMKASSENIALYAQTLFNLQQYSLAAQQLEKIADLPDVKSISLYQLGVSHSRAKNFPKAIAALERAGEMTANNVNIFRELGLAYEALKQKPKALTAYQKVLELAPNDEIIKKKVEKLTKETAKSEKQVKAKKD